LLIGNHVVLVLTGRDLESKSWLFVCLILNGCWDYLALRAWSRFSDKPEEVKREDSEPRYSIDVDGRTDG
jgi:hypothetical protein